MNIPCLTRKRNEARGKVVPNPILHLRIPLNLIPHRNNILTLPHANRTPTDFRPFIIRVRTLFAPTKGLPPLYDVVKLVSYYSKDEVFP